MISGLFCLSLTGCQSSDVKSGDGIEKPEDINATVGSISDIYQAGATEVRGFGVVANLAGTGSSECPEDLRKKLIKQIKTEMVDRQSINPDAFINSKNTAVVEVYGLIPEIASKGDSFDLRVAPLSNTQTTSLSGGHLYTTNLVEHSNIINFSMYLKTLAYAEGPIFENKLEDKNPDIVGDYILSGGRVAENLRITMLLHNQNFFTASLIRNLINERFGQNTAKAKSSGEIHLTIPPKYRHSKAKFLAMIRSLYIGSNPQLRQKRIDLLISDMITNSDKLTPEVGLEVIGISATDELSKLLSHPDEQVRLHAARCMLNIGDDRALKVLQSIIKNTNSTFRVEAIEAIGRGAKFNDAVTILTEHLQSEDFKVAFAVYEQLRNIRDTAVTRSYVGGKFYIDSIMSRGPKRIFVTRKGVPGIVIFGDPLDCASNLFVQSGDNDLIVNAREGDKYISISMKNPVGYGIIGPLYSSFMVKGLIKTLGELPKVPAKTNKRPGLNIPYSQIIALLKKMCTSGDIDAQFYAGELPLFPSIDTITPSEQKKSKK